MSTDDLTIIKPVSTGISLRASATGKQYALDGEMLVGREVECHIMLNSPNISRYHAKVLVSANSLFLEDLNSSNGTYVNGRRIHSRTPVSIGDEVCFDDISFRVTSPNSGNADTTQIGVPRKEKEATPPPPEREQISASAQQEVQKPAQTPERHLEDDIDNEDSDKTEMLSSTQLSNIKSLHEKYQSELTIGSGPRLIVMTAPIRGQVFSLDDAAPEKEWILGRADDADLQTQVISISRHHAKITKREDAFEISALDAINGLQVNGLECSTATLKHKDRLQIGRIEFTYRTDVVEDKSEEKEELPAYDAKIRAFILRVFNQSIESIAKLLSKINK